MATLRQNTKLLI